MNYINKIKKLQKLLKDAYDKYFEEEDTHHKSSEGYISVSIEYGTYFDEKYGEAIPRLVRITVYSYVFGPYRSHDFVGKTFKEAYKKAYFGIKDWLK